MKASGAPERMPTGIVGLDQLIEGGLIRGDIHLLVGGPGTGKSIFASHFVWNAASKLNLKAVYATFEESAESLTANTKGLGLDFEPLLREGKLQVVDLEVLRAKDLATNMSMLLSAVRDFEASVLVIDSFTAMLEACETPFELRTFTDSVYRSLKSEGITTLLTAGLMAGRVPGEEAFISDSVMMLEDWLDGPQVKRRFIVLKMRGTEHSRRYHSVVFAPGLTISRV